MVELAHRGRLPAFLVEAGQRLDDMDLAILRLAREPDNAAARTELARTAHAFKDDSAALGLKQLMLEAQRLELWAMAPVAPSATILSQLNEARSLLRMRLDELTHQLATF